MIQDCGKCTLCCKLFSVPYMDSGYGEYCRECLPGVGCKIHSTRPTKCKVFQCCYSQMKVVHPDLRPDYLGVVFEKITDTLILGTIDGKLEDRSELVNRQVRYFVNEGISVMMQQHRPHKWYCLMVPGANKEEIIKALGDKHDDSSELH